MNAGSTPWAGSPRTGLSAPARLGLMAAAAVLALALAWQAWQVNQRLACWANQWPGLDACKSINGQTPAQRVEQLTSRLARNPGDARAAIELAYWARQTDDLSAQEQAAHLAHAARLAPNDVAVLQASAQAALDRRDWASAVPTLARLSTLYRDSVAAQALADLVGQAVLDPGLQQALLQAARTDPAWMDRVVPMMSREKIPVITIMPLVSEAITHAQLPPRAGQTLVRLLKAEGHWLEAHAIWAHLWKRPLPYLFNGDFEQAFVASGFDWEVPGGRNDHRAGARVSLAGQAGRGQVLRVDFTGRAIHTPIVRQHLILPPATYRLAAQWQSADLRSSNGLVWRLTCVQSRREIGRSQAMKAAGRAWQTLDWHFTVPQDCGLAVELALLPQAAFETRTGLRGEVQFDRMEVTLSEGSP